MELYYLDEGFRPIDVLSDFIDLSWNERFQDVSECEIVAPYGSSSLARYRSGSYIGSDFSNRVMRIDRVYENRDEEGSKVLRAVCRSVEDVLRHRIAWRDIWSLGDEPKWSQSGTPMGIIDRTVERAIMGLHSPLRPSDLIPEIGPWAVSPPETNPMFNGEITVTTEKPMSVLDYIKDIAAAYGIGFRITRYLNMDTNEVGLWYQTYKGYDRSLEQENLDHVVFSPNLNNVSDMSIMENWSEYVNSVVVYSKTVVTEVYRDGTFPENFSGFNHKTMSIEVQDPEELETVAEIQAYQVQVGLEELAKRRPVFIVDGDLSDNSQYKYHTDYKLGDLVSLQADNGTTTTMRVMEQLISVSSGEYRSTPSLQAEELIKPGTWASFGNTEWLNAAGEWSTY